MRSRSTRKDIPSSNVIPAGSPPGWRAGTQEDVSQSLRRLGPGSPLRFGRDDAEGSVAWLHEALAAARRGETLAMVSIVGAQGSTPRELGARMLVWPDRFTGTIGGGS